MKNSTAEVVELSDLQVEEVVAGMDKGDEEVVRNRWGKITGTVRNGERFNRYGHYRGTVG